MKVLFMFIIQSKLLLLNHFLSILAAINVPRKRFLSCASLCCLCGYMPRARSLLVNLKVAEVARATHAREVVE